MTAVGAYVLAYLAAFGLVIPLLLAVWVEIMRGRNQ